MVVFSHRASISFKNNMKIIISRMKPFCKRLVKRISNRIVNHWYTVNKVAWTKNVLTSGLDLWYTSYVH